MANQVVAGSTGLVDSHSPLTQRGAGGLLQADNVLVSSTGEVYPRHGTVTSTAPQFAVTAAVVNSSDVLAVGEDKYGNVGSAGSALSMLEQYVTIEPMSGNFYVNGQFGTRKITATTDTPTGVAAGLDLVATQVSDNGGFTLADQAVAYRVLFATTDASNNLIFGAPTERVVHAKTTSGAISVSLNASLPLTATSDYQMWVFRTIRVSDTLDPGDEMFLVKKVNVTSTDVSNGYIDYEDDVPQAELGAALYINVSQEGIAQANAVPPRSNDLTDHLGYMMYPAPRWGWRVIFSFPFTTAPEAGLITYSESSNRPSGTFTNGSPDITSLSLPGVVYVKVGQLIQGVAGVPAGIPAGAKILSFAGTATSPTTITMDSNYAGTTGSHSFNYHDVIQVGSEEYYPADAEDLANGFFELGTSGSLVNGLTKRERVLTSLARAINRTSITFNARVVGSGSAAQLAVEQLPSGSALSVGSNDSVALPTETFQEVGGSSFLAWSKLQQPEHVPEVNYVQIGTSDNVIQRVSSLRDGLLIWTTNGLYRMTGRLPANFQPELLELSSKILFPQSECVAFGRAFAATHYGIVEADISGTRVISSPISRQLSPMRTKALNALNSIKGSPLETIEAVAFCDITDAATTPKSRCFVWNVSSRAWTTFTVPGSNLLALVDDPDSFKYHLIAGDSWRYTRAANDPVIYADATESLTGVTDSGYVLSYTNTPAYSPQVGDLVTAGSLQAHIMSVNGKDLTMSRDMTGAPTSATVYYRTHSNVVRWAPLDGGDPTTPKTFREVQLMLTQHSLHAFTLKTATDLSRTQQAVSWTSNESAFWRYEHTLTDDHSSAMNSWAYNPQEQLGGPTSVRTLIPSDHRWGQWVSIEFSTASPGAFFRIPGVAVRLDASAGNSRVRRSDG